MTLKGHCEKITARLSRPKQKLVTQVMYGLAQSQSCHLSEISRSLMENIPLKKTIERLRTRLADFSQTDTLMDDYLAVLRRGMDDKSILIVDGSDITKPCSKALEYLCEVRDGSTGEIGTGYHVLEVSALTQTHRMPVPVYSRIYSSIDPAFVSEDEEVLSSLRYLSQKFGHKCVRTMDRGYDTLAYYQYFIKHTEPFVIRCKKNRNVIYKGRTQNILEAAKQVKGKYRLDWHGKDGRHCECKLSMLPIRLPMCPKVPLFLVVIHGFGKDPMLLLTNLDGKDTRLCTTITKVYLMRWKIEEYFRFKKQQYHFEDIRVRTITAIRAINAILTCLLGLFALLSEKVGKTLFLCQLIDVSKRVDSIWKKTGKLKFIFYSLAYAFSAVFRKSRSAIPFLPRPPRSPAILQLSFPLG